MEKNLTEFKRLLEIMDNLRENCPWDRKQTMESLRTLTVEETYELADAILDGNMDEIKKELGDMLLHIVFYARIASEKNAFTIADVLEAINNKLIERHPHIYGNVKVTDEQEVKANWEKIKLKEGNTSVLGGVPNSLPAMVKATRIQEKAKGVGFDWEKTEQVWEKVQEELLELKAEADANTDKVEEEFGDLLFALINYARFIGINPENALEKTNKKFIKRFQFLEQESKKDGKKLEDMTLEEMDEYWNKAKNS